MIYRSLLVSMVIVLGLAMSMPLLMAQQPETGDKPAAKEEIFSGPQVGEKLPPLTVLGVFEDQKGKDLDLVKLAGEKPMMVVFVHKLTRPSVALVRVLMNFSIQRSDDLYGATVFLAADVSATQERLMRAKGALATKRPTTISPDGPEGPGAYGLNRNVTLTVIFAKDGKVISNYAIVDPSVQADTPRVLGSVIKTIGGKMPTLAQLGAARYTGNTNTPQAVNLRPILSPVIDKQATPEEVQAAAERAEAFFAKNPAARVQMGRVARRIIAGEVLGNYGTKTAQEYLKKWAKQYPEPKKPEGTPKRPSRPEPKPTR